MPDRSFRWAYAVMITAHRSVRCFVALSGTEWSSLGLLVFELVALVPRVAVVPHAESPATIGRHEPDPVGGRWNQLYNGWESPVERRAPIGPTKSPPRVEGKTPLGIPRPIEVKKVDETERYYLRHLIYDDDPEYLASLADDGSPAPKRVFNRRYAAGT